MGTAILTEILKRIAPDRAERLAGELMAGSGAVTSAEQGYRILDLADALRKDPAAEAWMRAESFDPKEWRTLPEDSLFRQSLNSFLQEFGHRAVYEGEIANPRWNENPDYILQQARAVWADATYAQRFQRSREAARDRRRHAEKEVAKRAWFLSPLVRWVAARTRRAYAEREAAKSALVAFLEPNRIMTLEVGRRMVERSLLDEKEDVFFLTRADTELFLRGEWSGEGAKALVADRKAQRERWLAEEAEDLIVIDEKRRPSSATDAATPANARRGVLSGVAVSPGQAAGPARILHHPNEGHLLRTGDVLVAPSTDPGWTPLFTRAVALVMEVGGYHSHGAIVAREYGIPAVANIPRIVRILDDGEAITVDGDSGLVQRGNPGSDTRGSSRGVIPTKDRSYSNTR